MKRAALILILAAATSLAAGAQGYPPRNVQATLWDSVASNWTPAVGTGTPVTGIYPPEPVALYCVDASGNLVKATTAGNCFGSSGSMTWPTGAAGIPNYNGSSAWGTSYNASNPIPNSFINFAAPGPIGGTTPAAGSFTTLAAGTAVLGPAIKYFDADGANAGICTTAATIKPLNGNNQYITLTNADTCALTFTAPSSGMFSVTIEIVQSAAGSFNGLISGGYWPNGSGFTTVAPTITATNGAVTFATCKVPAAGAIDTHTYCVLSQ